MPVVKIKTYKRPAFQTLLDYMLGEKDRLMDTHGRSLLVTHNLRGKTIDGWVKQFKENEKYRLRKRKNSVYLNHEIISFHRDSTKHLNIEKLEQLVREYFRLRGNMLAVATAHYDRYHIHLHICTSAIEYRTGKSMRMSRAELAALKKNLQQFQQEQFPELSRSVVRHGKGSKKRSSEKEILYKERTKKPSKRDLVKNTVDECFRTAKSEEEFFDRLKQRGLETYVRGGRVYGVNSEGRRFRFKTLEIDITQSWKNRNIEVLERNIQKKLKEKESIGKKIEK